jgi:hypothetical protein
MEAMSKRQLIDEILVFNASAEPAFLAEFDPSDLREYLSKLVRCAGIKVRKGGSKPAPGVPAPAEADDPSFQPADTADADTEPACPLCAAST